MRLSLLFLLPACGNTLIDPGTNEKPDTTTTANPDPNIALSTELLDFGLLGVGERDTIAIQVYNHGGTGLEVTGIAVDAPFSVNPPQFSVSAGSSGTLTLSVQPDAYGVVDGFAVISSNDPDTPEFSLPLRVEGISDVDGDGHATTAAGGDDCDDTDPTSYPGNAEEWYNGLDNDCSGGSDWDQDGDGWDSDTHDPNPETGGGDCQDVNAAYNPAAEDVPYDGADTNCDGQDDYDVDGDGYRAEGFGSGSDCNDADPTVNVEGVETLNGADDNCDGVIDRGAVPVGAGYTYGSSGAYDRTGYAVAAGDLDSDGFAEVIVTSGTAGASSAGASGRGGVAIFYSDPLLPSGTDVDAAESWFRGETGDGLGEYVAILGDFSGDGGVDVAISAPGATSGAGAVYVMAGADLMLGEATDRALARFDGAAGNSFGHGIASNLDLDGDGFHDLGVAYRSGSANYLAIQYGGASASVGVEAMDARFSTDGTESQFYSNAPVGGDLNGDGYADLVVCDGESDVGVSGGGALWALWGGVRYENAAAEDLGTVGDVLLAGTETNENLAWACALGEDWDGDGDAELWVYNAGAAVVVFPGSPDLGPAMDPASAVVSYDWGASTGDGESIRRIGDWSGDGVSEMAVGRESGGLGAVEIFSSEIHAGALDRDDDAFADIGGSSDSGSGAFGYAIAPTPADVDGDGDMDTVIGDPEVAGYAGSAYVFLNGME